MAAARCESLLFGSSFSRRHRFSFGLPLPFLGSFGSQPALLASHRIDSAHEVNLNAALLSCSDNAPLNCVLCLKQLLSAEPRVLHQSLESGNVAKDDGGHALHSAACATAG
jgi:hypothetical protein